MHKNIKEAFFAVSLFCIFLSPLFARGKQEETIRKSVNREFVLCITSFNVSALPPGLQVLGPILQREIVWDLNRIHHRVRDDSEVARYEQMAWAAAIHAAASEIAKKRDERDNLLFKGYPNWKYKKELKKINEDIKKLEEQYEAARKEKPIIEEQPLFKLYAGNTAATGTFPAAPEKGKEEDFLRTNNADAFMEGKFKMFYGRIYVEFRIFARGSSFVYEDSAIFSSENINTAADEIKHRFLGVLINSELVRLALNVDPENSQIEINGIIVKKGQIVELPPGPVVIAVSAADYHSIREELLMEGGESELYYELTRQEKETLRIKFPGPNSSVYSGSLYMGGNPVPMESSQLSEEEVILENNENDEEITEEKTETPSEEIAATADKIESEEDEESGTVADQLTEENTQLSQEAQDAQAGFFSINVPMGQYQYIRVETEDGLTGEAIVKGSKEEKDVRIVTLKPRKLPGKDDNPVERSRKKFYGAYGRFWIALPLAFIINGISQSYIETYNSTGNPELYNTAQNSYYVSIGAWSLTGVFLAETLIRMFIYVRTGTKESIQFVE